MSIAVLFVISIIARWLFATLMTVPSSLKSTEDAKITLLTPLIKLINAK